jgi:hypothetical protein
VSDIWTPPGAIPFDDEVERVITESDDPVETRAIAEELRELGMSFASKETRFGETIAAAEDPGLILLPNDWGRRQVDDGRNVLCAFVKSDELQRAIMDATLEVETFGVVEWAENPMIHALCPALSLRLPHFTTFTPLAWPDCPCPLDWRIECPQGFAIAVPHPDPTETRSLYVASPPMTAMPPGFTMEHARRKVGRNDKCPCGSGIKFKRCCGRG